MFKWILLAILALAIWGGLYKAIDFTDSEGNFSITIDKGAAIDSLSEGANKLQNVYENLEQLSEDKTTETVEQVNKP
jgi:hypothetical protein